jgi:nitroreductase
VDLYDVMRTTFAVREFTGEPLPDRTLYRILDHARFAPSGGNRQSVRIIVVRDRQTRDRLAELSVAGAQRYVAQLGIGEAPWNPLRPSSVPAADVDTTEVPDAFIAPLRGASVVLVVCLDLRYVAATDQDLGRVGVVSGASVYPLVWNILLATRGEGYGGNLSTMVVPQEPQVQKLYLSPLQARPGNIFGGRGTAGMRPCGSDAGGLSPFGSRCGPRVRAADLLCIAAVGIWAGARCGSHTSGGPF